MFTNPLIKMGMPLDFGFTHFARVDVVSGFGNGVVAGGIPADANTVNRIVISKTGIANNTPTAFAQISIPASLSGSAGGSIKILGMLGASGSVGAYEAAQVVSYDFVVTRAGSGTSVAGISTVYGSASGTFSGGTLPVVTATLGSASGAATAVQFVAINVNISATTIGANNMTAIAEVTLTNAVASGITIAAA